MTDEQAMQLLELLATYNADHGPEHGGVDPRELTVSGLAGDLLDSMERSDQREAYWRMRDSLSALHPDSLSSGLYR